MENLFRFKKRMVYPEKLSLDQIIDKTSSNRSAQNWCSGPLENNHTNHKISQRKEAEETSASSQFIQGRIRHLVDAFNTRTQTTRERIENPPTFSISSKDAIEPPLLDLKKKSLSSEPVSILIPKTGPHTNPDLKSVELLEPKVIDPDGKVYIIWMSIATLSVMYNVWMIPLRSTFPYQNRDNRWIWMTFDYLADFIYALDLICIQPKIKYLNEGFWVTDKTLLRHNYIKKRIFKYDLISLLPLDILYIVMGPEFVILRFPRFFKLHIFWKFFNHIDKLLSNPLILRIAQSLMYLMYLMHLNACAYYALSAWEGIASNSFVYDGRNSAYIKCFYFAAKTSTSIGKNPKPTQEIEYLFMTYSWLMGVFVCALFIGQVRDIIYTTSRCKSDYRKLINATLEYKKRLNLPPDVQKRVKLWVNYTWKTQRTLDEYTIIGCLPHKLKTDIAMQVHIHTLSKVKLFADCDEALLRELVLQLKSVIYLPDDIICKKGDIGKEMYIIQFGKVKVMRNETEVLATLSEGSVFGEISLLGIPGKNRRTADVRSAGFSNLFVLSKADLNAALSNFPETQKLLNEKAKQLMKQNAALERKHNAMIIIDNPTPPAKQAKLLDTVLQVVPADSKTNHLLRFGSRMRPRKPENDKFKYRNSLPSINDFGGVDKNFQTTKATVHRTLS